MLEVADLNHRGGPRYAYHVDFVPSDAGFALAASTDSLNIPAGGTAIVNVMATRLRYIGPIAVTAVDLPAGVTSVPTVIGPGQDSVELTLHATQLRPRRVHPIRIVGTARVRSADFQAVATITEVLKADLSGMPYPPESLTTATAFGIAPGCSLHPADRTGRVGFRPQLVGHGQSDRRAAKRLRRRDRPGDRPVGEGDHAAVASQASASHGPHGGPQADSQRRLVGRDHVFRRQSAALAEFTAVLEGTLKKGNQTHVAAGSRRRC